MGVEERKELHGLVLLSAKGEARNGELPSPVGWVSPPLLHGSGDDKSASAPLYTLGACAGLRRERILWHPSKWVQSPTLWTRRWAPRGPKAS